MSAHPTTNRLAEPEADPIVSTWLRPDEAAAALGVTIANVRVIAHREGWRKIRHGRHVAYHLDDVADTDARRAQNREPQGRLTSV